MTRCIIIMFLLLYISGCDNKYHLPGSSIENYEAIKESMFIATSKTTDKKSIDPLIGLCIAAEDPIEPDQLIIDKCYYQQKFKVLEIISGFIENEFNCAYSVSLSQNEQSIKKNDILILILGEEKSVGNYCLIKALENTKANRNIILKTGGKNGTIISISNHYKQTIWEWWSIYRPTAGKKIEFSLC